MLSSSQLVPSGSKLQQVAANGSGTTNENDTVHFKEWVTAILSWQKQMHYFQGWMATIRVVK